MTVAVVGGGIQGCSVAVELALRHVPVVLFEGASRPMERASRWNEGKIHLGYIYANDPSLATAHTMVRGAMVFHRRMSRYLERPIRAAERSSAFVYGVHRNSMVSREIICSHIARVDRIIADELEQTDGDYLGERYLPKARPVSGDDTPFDPALVDTAIATPELAVDPHLLADALAERVLSDPLISVAAGCRIRRIGLSDDRIYRLEDGLGRVHGPFDCVVNASWESRLALDATIGLTPPFGWIHRYKLALHARSLEGYEAVGSVTITLGPFGDVVSFAGGRLYLSWYPATRIAVSSDIAPPEPEENLTDEMRTAVAGEVIEELSRLLPALRKRAPDPAQFDVRGGHIVAWGTSDINDPGSRLHQRHAVGVRSFDGYHSVDTGKYGLAPLHAAIVAQRIAGEV